ncbi:MAG: YraN family protein [Anaerolineales bacterium]
MEWGSLRNLGRRGEELAVAYLEEKGYRILERNYFTSYGEIDIIASYQAPQEVERLVFVEVKARRNRRFGFPEESITPKKLNHLILSCQDYLQKHSKEDSDWQIDVISIEFAAQQEPIITHLDNVTVSLNLTESKKTYERK